MDFFLVKNSIGKVVMFAKSHDYCVSKEEKVYQEFQGMVDEVIGADNHKGIKYRERIKHLENLLKESEPALKI